jgi:hypothetical protein
MIYFRANSKTGQFLALLSFLVSMASGFLMPRAFAAQNPSPGAGGAPVLFTSIGAVNDKICVIFYWLFTAAIIISIIMILLAAIKYMTGGGFITKGSGSEAVTNARKDLLYAVVGIGIAILAKATPSIIASFLGTTLPPAC